MSKERVEKILLRDVAPLVGWAVALQLLFDGPWMPHKIDLYASLCFLLIVYGGQLLATETKRLLQFLLLWKESATSSYDALKASRGFGTMLLVALEIGTTLWDQQVGASGRHFPLLARVVVLILVLPILSYTSRALLRAQDREVIAHKLQGKTDMANALKM